MLCGDSSSALARAAQACAYCEVALFDLPAGKDGFLATNSLLAFCVVLARAYEGLQSGKTPPFYASALLQKLAGSPAMPDEFAHVRQVLERETLIVLHGSASGAAAWDLESRFTEAALGHVQTADYRNFAHGRHHWLAKHGQQSGVVAFVGHEESALAAKTLEIIPSGIPALRIRLSTDWKQAGLEAIAASLRLAQWKGTLRGIDPGRPGVPPFGHLMYELEYDCEEVRNGVAKIDEADRAPLERKTGQALERLAALGSMQEWLDDLNAYRRKRAKHAVRRGGVRLRRHARRTDQAD